MRHATAERNTQDPTTHEADPIGSTILGHAVARRNITGRAELVTSCDLTRDEADREADGLTAENHATTQDVFVPVQIVEPDSRLTPVHAEGMPIGCWDVKNIHGGANFWFGTREQAEAHANRWGDGRAMGMRVGVWVDADEYDAWQRSKTPTVPTVPVPRDGGYIATTLGVLGLLVGVAFPLVHTAALNSPQMPLIPLPVCFLLIGFAIAVCLYLRHPRVRSDRSPYPGQQPGVRIPQQRRSNGENTGVVR